MAVVRAEADRQLGDVLARHRTNVQRAEEARRPLLGLGRVARLARIARRDLGRAREEFRQLELGVVGE